VGITISILILILSFSACADSIPEMDTVPKYHRKYFKHWTDENKDCQDTRAEVLIRDNLNGNVLYKTDKKCMVIYGAIYDHFTDSIVPSNDADIDHTVPLKQSWISGAWKWTSERREEYANYMEDKWHLLSVVKGENRSKGSKSPDQWMPPNKKFHVAYCLIWIRIKNKWQLTATEKEIEFIKNVLKDYDKKGKLVYPEVREEWK